MKIIHIEARKKFSEIDLFKLDRLPGKTISLSAIIQYINLVPIVKSYLESKGKKVIIKKGAFYNAHVLGCNPSAFDKNADTLLLIGDGKFHALNNAVQLGREIYVFNAKYLEKVSKEDIERITKQKQIKVARFLSADKVGIIISSKNGQFFKKINTLKKKIELLNKRVYVFEADNINTVEFDNFNIPLWINTACCGLELDDKRIINYKDIIKFL